MFVVSSIKKPKAIIGILLALIMIYCARTVYPDNQMYCKVTYCSALLSLLAGFIKFTPKSSLLAIFVNLLWGAGCLLFAIIGGMPWGFALGLQRILMNYLCALYVAAVLYVITARWKLSVSLAAGALAILYMINTIVFDLRGNELLFLDLLSVRTALSVAGNYRFSPSVGFIITFVATTGALYSQLALPPFPSQKAVKWISRSAVAIFLCFASWAMPKQADTIPVRSYRSSGTYFNGFTLNFYLSIHNMQIKQPDGYTPEYLDAVCMQYQDPVLLPEKKPNIVVIMCESFADF